MKVLNEVIPFSCPVPQQSAKDVTCMQMPQAAAVVDGTPVEHALEPVPEYVAEVAVPEGVTGPVLEDPAPEPTVVPEHMKEPSAAVASGNVSAKLVKELRDQSGAGMMDCKKALAECGGDLQAAAEFLRKKGIAKASKKAGRTAADGMIGSYIHAGMISDIPQLFLMKCWKP